MNVFFPYINPPTLFIHTQSNYKYQANMEIFA